MPMKKVMVEFHLISQMMMTFLNSSLIRFVSSIIYVAFRVVLRGYVCSDLLYALKGKGGRIGALVDSHISVSSAW